MTTTPQPESPSDTLASRIPFFYGWVMLAIIMVIQIATSPGQTFGISVFNPYLVKSLYLSQSELSGAYMMGTLLASIPMVLVGAAMDRYGPRRVLFLVVLLFGVACYVMSNVSGFYSLFFAFLLLRMLGQGAMGLLGINSLALWFNRNLGFASGVGSLVATLIFSAFPALHLYLIHSFGWQHAYVLLGIGVWVVVLPLLIAFRNRPEDVGQFPDGRPEIPLPSSDQTKNNGGVFQNDLTLREAFRTRSYWIMIYATAVFSLVVTGMTFNTVQLFLDHGLSEMDAAATFISAGIASAIARLGGGILADRLRLNLLLSVSMVVTMLGIFTAISMSTPLEAHVYAVVTGIARGIYLAVDATLWVRYFGRSNLGKIRGSLTTVGVAASSLGPFLMGYAHDSLGDYDMVLWIFALVLYSPLVLITLMATPPRENLR
jgi:MFS family permease